MILLPIGRDDAIIQRHAWISYAIIALNVLVWLFVSAVERQSVQTQIEDRYADVLRFVYHKPYLELPESIAPYVSEQLKAQLLRNVDEVPRPMPETIEAEQEQLEQMAAGVMTEFRRLPRMRFGYIPAEASVLTLVTSMFIHAGFMHLLGNLLFFFVTGPFIEDVFGRPLFAFLYITGGFMATWTFASQHGDSMIPLVGASGAIAAVMGAYLVRFLTSKLEFIFVPFLFRPMLHFRFFVPAFVVLPLWFAQQAFLMSSEAGSGVAFSAHVGGFVYGLLFAIVVKITGFEEKFVAPVVEKETTWKADDRLVEALQLKDAGDLQTAKVKITSALVADPNGIEALAAAVDIAKRLDDRAMLDIMATRLLSRYAEEKQHDVAFELMHELTVGRGPAAPPLMKFLARAAQFAERTGDRDWAVNLYERICDAEPNSINAVPSLVKLGTLLRAQGDVKGARTALTRARTHPACSPEWAPTIDAKLAQMEG